MLEEAFGGWRVEGGGSRALELGDEVLALGGDGFILLVLAGAGVFFGSGELV